MSDLFPATVTSIPAGLEGDEAQREAVRRYVAEVYARPLEAYAQRLRLPSGEDSYALVSSLVERILRDPAYLDRWRASGKRLHQWLANGLHLELRNELARRMRRSTKDLPEELGADQSPDAILRKGVAEALVARAVREAQSSLPGPQHWEILRRHVLEKLDFAALGEIYGVSAERAAVMARTARRRIRKSLEALLVQEGWAMEELGAGLDELLGDLS